MVEQTVTLAPGESQVVAFEATPHEAKTYHVTVDGLSGSFRAIEVPGIQLTYSWNVITYPGPSQEASVAFQSIRDYVKDAMYARDYQSIQFISNYVLIEDVMLEPGMELAIWCNQACVWTF